MLAFLIATCSPVEVSLAALKMKSIKKKKKKNGGPLKLTKHNKNTMSHLTKENKIF